MVKEPYNLFGDARSTLPGGSAYEDLMVVLKAIIHESGGRIVIREDLLMYIDRDESIRVDDVFFGGWNRKVFTIETKLPNQNPESHIKHEEVEETNEASYPLWVKFIALLIWMCVVFAVVVLVGQLIRAVVT